MYYVFDAVNKFFGVLKRHKVPSFSVYYGISTADSVGSDQRSSHRSAFKQHSGYALPIRGQDKAGAVVNKRPDVSRFAKIFNDSRCGPCVDGG